MRDYKRNPRIIKRYKKEIYLAIKISGLYRFMGISISAEFRLSLEDLGEWRN